MGGTTQKVCPEYDVGTWEPEQDPLEYRAKPLSLTVRMQEKSKTQKSINKTFKKILSQAMTLNFIFFKGRLLE